MGFYLFTGCLIWLTQVTNNVNTCTQSIYVTGKCRIRDVLQSVSNQHQIQVEYLSENVNWLPIPVSYPSGWTLTCKPRSVLATCTHDMDISFLFLDSQTIRWNRVCMCWISFFFIYMRHFIPCMQRKLWWFSQGNCHGPLCFACGDVNSHLGRIFLYRPVEHCEQTLVVTGIRSSIHFSVMTKT